MQDLSEIALATSEYLLEALYGLVETSKYKKRRALARLEKLI